jgi:hypothetical protein
MPMQSACPVTKETVDERAARLCALLALLPLGLSLLVVSPWPTLLLAVDFGLRGFGARWASPVARAAQAIAPMLGWKPRRVNAGPKAFAAKLGCGFSLAVGLALWFGEGRLGAAVAVPFAACAILEGGFGYCVGCRFYQLWQRLRPGARLSRVRL